MKGIKDVDTNKTAPIAENPLLAAAAELIALHAEMDGGDTSQEANNIAYDELPALVGPGRWGEGCAAFAMAMFGEELIKEVDWDKYGSVCQTAFQIANVYLSLPLNHPAMNALENLAVVAHLQAQEETAKTKG